MDVSKTCKVKNKNLKVMRMSTAVRFFHILLFVCVFLGVQTYAQVQSSARVDAQKLVVEGDNQLRGGNWQGALFAYDNAVATDPSFAIAHMKKGHVLYKIGRNAEARNSIDKAIRLNPYTVGFYDERAKIRMLALDYKGALNDLTEALRLDPDNSTVRDHRVDDFIAMGAYERALQDIDTLLITDYNVVRELEKKALIHLLEDDTEACATALDQIMEQTDSSAFAYDLKGVLALKDKRTDEAYGLFSEALKRDSNMVVALHNRAIAARIIGNEQQALADLNKAINIKQETDLSHYKRALLLKEMGDYQGALQDYDKAIELNDDFDEAFYNRAFTHKLLGDYTSAMDDVEEILFNDPNSADAHNMKGNLLFLYGDYCEAIDVYSEALTSNPEMASTFFNRGLAALMSNMYSEGCADLQQSASLGYHRAAKVHSLFCTNTMK